MIVSVARSLAPLVGATDIAGSVVRSAATSPVVQVESDEGGARGIPDVRALLAGALGAGSGAPPAAGAPGSGGGGNGTVRIRRVLNGSFIDAGKVSAGRLPAGRELPTQRAWDFSTARSRSSRARVMASVAR